MRFRAFSSKKLVPLQVFGLIALCGTDPAHAQDDGRISAQLRVSPLWAGIYAGVHVGRAQDDSAAIDFGAPVVHGAFACDAAVFPNCGSPFDYGASGWLSGIQLGYNWQPGALLFGIEGDLGRIDVNHTSVRGRALDQDVAEIDYGWSGALTARIGLPTGRALLYLKGGGAFAEIKTTAADRDEAFGAGSGLWYSDPLATVRVSGLDLGWVVGGGIEYALTASWSVKAEYLYMDFGANLLTDADGDRYGLENQLHSVKFGLNYHPAGGEGAPAAASGGGPAGAPLWDGRYLGVHAAWAQDRTRAGGSGAPVVDGAFACVPGGYCGRIFDYEADSWVSGVQAGQNWQLGGLVFGVEGDLGRIDLQSQAFVENFNGDHDVASVDYGWYGAATARVGLPFDRAMIYLKGGLAVAEITNTGGDLDAFVTPGGTGYYVHPLSLTHTHRLDAGWTLGGGVEYALSRAWRLKAEYLYMDFGSTTSADPDGDRYEHENALHVAKLGLNYAFDPAEPALK